MPLRVATGPTWRELGTVPNPRHSMPSCSARHFWVQAIDCATSDVFALAHVISRDADGAAASPHGSRFIVGCRASPATPSSSSSVRPEVAG
ncbi:protein of unknown function [Micropruina glycogenica]|uniref:Uncharacterized protein n=1 Tax=Micropruina glycogenica TaxID=75385 RepID=A0A2N9JGS6_9ACTN|nr:protein of unknown function [Micropruina glycogenica]